MNEDTAPQATPEPEVEAIEPTAVVEPEPTPEPEVEAIEPVLAPAAEVPKETEPTSTTINRNAAKAIPTAF